ncbi:MAG: Csp1 family four helix bundle copper storage protein [Pseudomonadota bacterium]
MKIFDLVTPTNMNRRFVLASALALPVMATSHQAAADEHGHSKKHKHHMKENPHKPLIRATTHCLEKAKLCQGHCLHLIKMGDKSIIDCLRTVEAMMPACETMATLASLESEHLPRVTKAMLVLYEDCEKECRKHEHHAECKACAEACKACIEHAKKIV